MRLRKAEREAAIAALDGRAMEASDYLAKESAYPELRAEALDTLLVSHNASRVLRGLPRQTLADLGWGDAR